jgi:hypothetical protein
VLATSVNHLCERLNTECCQRPPKGRVFKSVQKWGRPALCCDVQKWIENGNEIIDAYIDVDFCVCDCVSYIDPCDCDGFYYIPSCDQFTPANPCTAQAVSQESPFSFAGFNMGSIEVMEPKVEQIMATRTASLSSNIHLKHNLTIMPEEIDLFYARKSWQKNLHVSGRQIFVELSCENKTTQYDWKFQLVVNHNGLNSRLVINFVTHDLLDNFSFDYNTSMDSVSVSHPAVIKNHLFFDKIGLWQNQPSLSFTVG